MVNTKRALAIILLVVLTLSCIACDSEKPQEADGSTEEFEWVIKMAYLDTFENDRAIKPRHLSLRHYGCYDGAYVFFVDGPYGYMTMIRSEEIGSRTFLFPSSQELYVFKDGEIKALRNAYSAGWLSDKALADLHKSFSE